jgi:hypothetical protein
MTQSHHDELQENQSKETSQSWTETSKAMTKMNLPLYKLIISAMVITTQRLYQERNRGKLP